MWIHADAVNIDKRAHCGQQPTVRRECPARTASGAVLTGQLAQKVEEVETVTAQNARQDKVVSDTLEKVDSDFLDKVDSDT